MCDRLLLLGLLADRTHLTDADVAEVVNELSLESHTALAPLTSAEGAGGAALNGVGVDTLQRLERRLLRLEQLGAQTLATLERLAGSMDRSD